MSKFDEIRLQCNMSRRDEKEKIIKFLKDENFDVKPFEVDKLIGNFYDFTNFECIEVVVKKNGMQINVIISLQASDIDPKSKNSHGLLDRIGIFIVDDKINDYQNMIVTEFELPMNDKKLIAFLRPLNYFIEKQFGELTAYVVDGKENCEDIKSNFKSLKNQYNKLRSEERKKIIKYLQDEGSFIIHKVKGGKGRSNYTSDGNLATPYDLSNWKWIELSKGEMIISISLQPFEKNLNSSNRRILMDRIGIYCKNPKNSKESLITDINLPMNGDKLDKLLYILNEYIEESNIID